MTLHTPPLTARPHQRAAVDAVVSSLQEQPRAQVVMACGTGKTLVGAQLADRLQARTTLVVVPSLALLAQTLTEWRSTGSRFEALVLCSDPSTTDGDLERAGSDGSPVPAPFWARHRARVTTSPSVAARALAGRAQDRPMVVFSTYHSAHVLQTAAADGLVLDLVVADEAHHLAGEPRAELRCLLDDQVIPARARVFMTATPVLCTQDTGDWTSSPVSMDDENLFGPVAYRLDFAAAIAEGLLSDYQVLIYETASTSTDRPDPAAALAAAAEHGVSRVLSFHGRVAKARAFADAVDGMTLPDGRRVVARSVAGIDPALHRSRTLDLLRDPDPAVLVVVASARCLTEGVDVPAVDAVLFADPKHSTVDVVQAVGRALRLAPGKSHGTVLVPVVHIPELDSDTLLSTSSFSAVWRILRGLRALDPTLEDDLTQIVRGSGSRRGRLDGTRQARRLRFEVAEDLQAPLDELIARLVDQDRDGWDGFFTELEQFAGEHGHCETPARHRLRAWCQRQRTAYRHGMLHPRRAAALRALPGWAWDLAEQHWLEQLAQVAAAAGNGLDLEDQESMATPLTRHSRSGARTIGTWCAQQRILHRHGDLEHHRAALLEQVPGWSWAATSQIDQDRVDLLGEYVAWKGDANVPGGLVEDDQPLGRWLTDVRRARAAGSLSQALLDEITVQTPTPPADGALRWEHTQTQWLLSLEALRQFAGREGTCRVPDGHVEQMLDVDTKINLSTWCRRVRHEHRHGQLDPTRAQALEQVPGWAWEIQPSPRISIDIGDSRHGTRTGYVKGCRCVDCTEANRRIQRARTVRVRDGGASTDLVDAGLARGHLRVLTGRGASIKALARAAELNVKSVAEVADGTRARILPETHQTLMGLTLQSAQDAAAPGTTIPAGPTWALIDELLERGWSKSWIAREAGLGTKLQLNHTHVTAANAEKIADLHQVIKDLPVPPRLHRAPTPPLAELLSQATQARSA